MPSTPFHLGPTLLLGAVLYRRLDLPTLLVSSVVVDVRAALVVFGPLDGPVHGILTTFAGGTGVALLVAGVVTALRRDLRSSVPDCPRSRASLVASRTGVRQPTRARRPFARP